jgi:hypothetical protein
MMFGYATNETENRHWFWFISNYYKN